MKLWLALSSSAWIRLLSSTSIFFWRIKDSPAIPEDHFISFYFCLPLFMYNYVNLCGTTLSLAYLESYSLFGILFKWINFRLITTRCDHLDLPITALFYLSKFAWLLPSSSQLLTQLALTVLCVDALSIVAITAVPMTHPESQPDKCPALLWTAISHAWTHSPVSLFLTAPLILFSSAGRNAERRNRLVEIR
jgi:hypothetical protein